MGCCDKKDCSCRKKNGGATGPTGPEGPEGQVGMQGQPGAQGPTGNVGPTGSSVAAGIVWTGYVKQDLDTSVNSGFNPQFSDLGSLSIIRTTTQPTSKLLIWATFSSANDTPGSTNHFRITINGSQEEGCATSLYGPDSVVESGSMVVSVGPLPVGTYTIKVQWKSGVGPVGPTIAFVRPASRSDSEHADLLVMESVV